MLFEEVREEGRGRLIAFPIKVLMVAKEHIFQVFVGVTLIMRFKINLLLRKVEQVYGLLEFLSKMEELFSFGGESVRVWDNKGTEGSSQSLYHG